MKPCTSSFLKWLSVMSSAPEIISANSSIAFFWSREVRFSPVHADLVREHRVLQVLLSTVDHHAVWTLVGQAGHHDDEFLVNSADLACFLAADGIVISKEVSEFQWPVRQHLTFGKTPASRGKTWRQ